MDVPKLMKYFDYMPDVYCWIGGGGLRSVYDGSKTKDIDFFVTCKEDFEKSVDHFLSNGMSLVRKLDIHYWFQRQDGFDIDLFCKEEGSDYTVCACAIDRHGSLFQHPAFLKDALARRLIYLGNEINKSMAKSRPNRLNRFLKIGYDISKEELIKVTDRMVKDKVPLIKDYWKPTIQDFNVHVRHNHYNYDLR